MKILEKLDFTLYQRKIIESLIRYHKLNASQIAKNAKIAPNKVYQTINELIAKNIVIETNTKPKVYTLINIDNYLKKAIEKKEKELSTLEDEYEEFIKSYNESSQIQNEFWILENMNALLHKIEPTMENLKEENVGFIEEWTMRFSLLKIVRQKIKMGKSIRFVTRFSPKSATAMKKWLQYGVKIRHYSNMDCLSGFGVFDKKHVKISLKQKELKSIWIENESLAKILHEHFENIWEKSKEITLENIDEFEG